MSPPSRSIKSGTAFEPFEGAALYLGWASSKPKLKSSFFSSYLLSAMTELKSKSLISSPPMLPAGLLYVANLSKPKLSSSESAGLLCFFVAFARSFSSFFAVCLDNSIALRNSSSSSTASCLLPPDLEPPPPCLSCLGEGRRSSLKSDLK
jgi:hypothetical protein